jgi:cell division protein FtsQ
MIKKALIIGGWAFCAIAIVFLLAFAGKQHGARITTGVEVSITRKADQKFVTEEDVKTSLISHGYGLPNQTLNAIDIPAIERLVSAHAAVESCEACVNVEGKVMVSIVQRRPIARLMNLSGESYYFDDRGKLMPWSDEYTAPVILVNGYFADSYATMSAIDFSTIAPDSAVKSVTLLDDIWQVVKSIDADSFLRVQMVQLYLSQQNGFELVPRVGGQKIVLGTAEGVDGKFKKLSLFYTYGLNQTSRWNDYSVIDLRFKNQIVCTKKPITNGI